MNVTPLASARVEDLCPDAAPQAPLVLRPRLGEILTRRQLVPPEALRAALEAQSRSDARLGEILEARGHLSSAALHDALAEQWKSRVLDLVAEPPDPELVDSAGAGFCLRHGLVPWRRIGGATVFATSRPGQFREFAATLPAGLRPALMAIVPEGAVIEAVAALRSARLVARAETRAPAAESCRTWDGRRFRLWLVAALSGLAGALILAPVGAIAALTVLAATALAATTILRLSALFLALRRGRAGGIWQSRDRPVADDGRLPRVSVLVPLYHERAISERLVRRLDRLIYPRELLDICLVTEDDDSTTGTTLAGADLPAWMRVIEVPRGTLRTKPRALNYALDFCRGSIVGVYDAEDAPDPDQIHRVVARFRDCGPEVACLQGILDYYNARSNWMARCFALEYAAWFRIILPGLQRMGFAIPLGGTTLFFRRAALEALGGWDAHNVTEDADLGIRLARHGYRAEIVPTVTHEEANSRPWPWVRQRSRWIKGYAMTWAVHMRAPGQLWRDLGPWRFLGVQLLFGGSLAQVFLAPVLWSYWLVVFGLPHPVADIAPRPVLIGAVAGFLLAYLSNIAVMAFAASGPAHRHLIGWTPTTDLYFPLATVAAFKALLEMVTRPFFWDKTSHGQDDAAAGDGGQDSRGDAPAAEDPSTDGNGKDRAARPATGAAGRTERHRAAAASRRRG